MRSRTEPGAVRPSGGQEARAARARCDQPGLGAVVLDVEPDVLDVTALDDGEGFVTVVEVEPGTEVEVDVGAVLDVVGPGTVAFDDVDVDPAGLIVVAVRPGALVAVVVSVAGSAVVSGLGSAAAEVVDVVVTTTTGNGVASVTAGGPSSGRSSPYSTPATTNTAIVAQLEGRNWFQLIRLLRGPASA